MAAEGLPVELACRILGVSVSGYFIWRKRPPSPRAIRHAWLSDVIAAVHGESRQTYGARRVQAELTLGRGIAVGHNAVELLMRRVGWLLVGWLVLVGWLGWLVGRRQNPSAWG